MLFRFPLLMADIGGTNARFSTVDARGRRATSPWSEPTSTNSDLAVFAETFVQKLVADGECRPQSMIVCAAGPLRGRSVKLTNIDMQIDGPRLAERLSLKQGLLLNDFEAQAIALPQMHRDIMRQIGPQEIDANTLEPRLVFGPGTGLGAATLVAIKQDKHVVRTALPSEAGHMKFAASGKLEQAIVAEMTSDDESVPAEFILSGAGLGRVAAAWRRVHGFEAQIQKPECVLANALKNSASPEADTIRLYWNFVAGFASDLALAHMATGGVVLSGGVLPRLLPFLKDDAFRHAFSRGNSMRELLDTIPTALITQSSVLFDGMANLAANPQSYAIDYGKRLWVI